MTDFRLLALEMANDEAALLRERVASLEEDVASYRDVAYEAIQALHHVTRERDRLTSENIRLREQLRERSAA